MNAPPITVIMVTRNRPVSLAKCLAPTRAVLPKAVRILVFDDASRDGAAVRAIVKAHPNTDYLRSETVLGPAGGRNRCLHESTTPFCFSIDDDCYLASMPDLSRWFTNRAEDRDIAIVGFRYCNMPANEYAPPSDQQGPAKGFHGGASLLRRAAVMKVGGFLDWLVFAAEDTELAMRLNRLGYRIWYDPSVIVHHDHSLEGRDQGWGSYHYVRNTVVVNALHRGGLTGLWLGIARGLRRGIFATEVPSKTPGGILMGVLLAWRYRRLGRELFANSRRYVPGDPSVS